MSVRRREALPRHQAGSLLGQAAGFKPGFALQPVGVQVGLQGYFTVEIRCGDIGSDADQDFISRQGLVGKSVKIAVTSVKNIADRRLIAENAAMRVRAAVNNIDPGRLSDDLRVYNEYVCSNSFRSRYVVVMEDVGGDTDIGGTFPSTTLAEKAMGYAAGVAFFIPGDSDPGKLYSWQEDSFSDGEVKIRVSPLE